MFFLDDTKPLNRPIIQVSTSDWGRLPVIKAAFSSAKQRFFIPSRLIYFVTLLALFLRTYRLDWQSLWFDEAYTLLITNMDLADSIRALVADGVHPPLYYLL